MKKMILVAHGNGGGGTFSIPKVKTITPAGEPLTFTKAKEYMNSSNAWPEYSSTSFEEFSPLSDVDCQSLFNKVPVGNGIVTTGLRRGGDVGGVPIYALRGHDNLSRQKLSEYIDNNKITSLILLACRSYL